MNALSEAIKKIQAHPDQPTSSTLSNLIRALDANESFDLQRLYQLNYGDFSLAMEILRQWRLDSYRYERGALSKAATDPTAHIDVATLRYGRLGSAS